MQGCLCSAQASTADKKAFEVLVIQRLLSILKAHIEMLIHWLIRKPDSLSAWLVKTFVAAAASFIVSQFRSHPSSHSSGLLSSL